MKLQFKQGSEDMAELIISELELIQLKKELKPFMKELDEFGDYSDPETAAIYYHFFAKTDSFEIQFDCIEMIKMELDFEGITGIQCDTLNFEIAKFMMTCSEYVKWNNESFIEKAG